MKPKTPTIKKKLNKFKGFVFFIPITYYILKKRFYRKPVKVRKIFLIVGVFTAKPFDNETIHSLYLMCPKHSGYGYRNISNDLLTDLLVSIRFMLYLCLHENWNNTQRPNSPANWMDWSESETPLGGNLYETRAHVCRRTVWSPPAQRRCASGQAHMYLPVSRESGSSNRHLPIQH